MPKLAGLWGAAAMTLAFALPATAQDAQVAPTVDTVVATVNGTEITLGQMIVMRENLPPEYLQLPDDVLFNGILDQLVQQYALAGAAEPGLTQRQKWQIEAQRLNFLSNSVLEEAAKAAVTEQALQKLFEEKYANAAPSKEFNAAHILVATEDEAKAVKAELDGGGDFAEIAKAKSTDPGSGQNGGELGWFGLGMMVPEFEAAVIALQAGQVSDPVQSQFGWHVIRLNETRDKTVTLDEVRDELAAEIQGTAVEAKVNELTDAATVTRSAEGIDPAILKNPDLFGE